MKRSVHAAVLMVTLAVGSGAAPPPPPTTAPAPSVATTTSQPAYRTKFSNGDPINDYFTAMAKRFDVMIVQPGALDAFILKDTELPGNFAEALKTLRENLAPQGYAAIQSFSAKHLVVHVVSDKDAKRLALAESPVSYGTAGEKVDVTDPERQVTHLFPVNHLDMLDSLTHAAKQDADVEAEVTGDAQIGVNLILTGPALKVQRMVETLAKIDGIKEAPIIARTLQLQHLDAKTIADTLNQGFVQGSAPMKAVVDVRTNSIVVTGPEDQVLEVMVALIGQDAARGPILPRPDAVPPKVEPPPHLPEVPQPQEPKPSARGGLPSSGLDEIKWCGDNANPALEVMARPGGTNFWPNVNEGVFL